MLVDHQIQEAINRGRLIIDPWSPDMLQPASIDLKLDRFFRVYDEENTRAVDPRSSERRTKLIEVPEDGIFGLRPQAFALASTVEKITLPNNMVGKLEGKSSLARMGLFVHVTAGFFDPGFSGTATLELFNASPYGMILVPGMPICQMGFDYSSMEPEQVGSHSFRIAHPPAKNPYQGKYMNQPAGPQESMYYKNFEDAEG